MSRPAAARVSASLLDSSALLLPTVLVPLPFSPVRAGVWLPSPVLSDPGSGRGPQCNVRAPPGSLLAAALTRRVSPDRELENADLLAAGRYRALLRWRPGLAGTGFAPRGCLPVLPSISHAGRSNRDLQGSACEALRRRRGPAASALRRPLLVRRC